MLGSWARRVDGALVAEPRDERELIEVVHVLADRGVALHRDMALSRARLDQLGPVNAKSMTLSVGAGVVLHVVYCSGSLYCVLADSVEDLPLLDVAFPDVTARNRVVLEVVQGHNARFERIEARLDETQSMIVEILDIVRGRAR